MDLKLRAILESLIDQYSMPDQIKKFVEAVQDFKPYIKNERDLVFGWIMGSIETGFISVFFSVVHRTPSKEEMDEVHSIVKRRSIELLRNIERELMR
jgi:hypothetical protein